MCCVCVAELVIQMQTAKEPLTSKQISDNLGKNYNTTRVMLSKMVADGSIKQTGTKYYINSINNVNGINNVNSINSNKKT